MNKPTDKDARLLAETLHDDWAEGAPAGFARAAAAHARRRRRVRHTLGGTAVAAIGAMLALTWWPESEPDSARVAVAALSPPSPQASIPPRGYEIISDEELLAQFKDRPLLLVQGTNGSRDLTFLGTEPAPVEAGSLEEE